MPSFTVGRSNGFCG